MFDGKWIRFSIGIVHYIRQTLVYVTVIVPTYIEVVFSGKNKKNEIYELYSIDRIY